MTAETSLGHSLTVGPIALRNRVFLAPLSGVTDRPFRTLAWSHGAGLVVSEMVASGELAKGRIGSARRIERVAGAPHMVQLAGRDAASLAAAARIAEAEGADIIDINMGCPAKKVTGGYCGSALMREPDHAIRLVEAVIAAVAVPVTVKMRLGWDADTVNAPDIARRAEAAGAAMLTIHGRTRCQFYTGTADWAAVRSVRDAVRVPLVVNGDIRSAAEASAALAASGADAVMIGRGHYGAPWTAGEVAAAFGATRGAPAPAAPVPLADYVAAHHEAMLLEYGREQGMRHARKHIGWYLDRFAPLAGDRRSALLTTGDPEGIRSSLETVFGDPASGVHLAAAA